jgi:hypothetical protein
MDADEDEPLAHRFTISLHLRPGADILVVERLVRDNYGPAVREMVRVAERNEDGALEERLRVSFDGLHACREARGNMLKVLLENAAPLGVDDAWLV